MEHAAVPAWAMLGLSDFWRFLHPRAARVEFACFVASRQSFRHGGDADCCGQRRLIRICR